jgi:hypothetical protein
MGRPAIHPIHEFNGVRYYRKPSGYYKADHKLGGAYLHRVVWAHHHGPIPPDHHVHHIDHDPTNNAIENLELLSAHEHAIFHFRVDGRLKDYANEEWMAKIRGLAAVARRTPAVRAKMSAAATLGAQRAVREIRVCVVCAREYSGQVNKRKRGYCGMSCQGIARRASGVDDVDRTCVCCGVGFRANKHTKKETCSQSCAGRVAASRRHANSSL